MIQGIGKRELTSECGRAIKDGAACHLPLFLRHRRLLPSDSCDKAFAAAWIDDRTALIGTKDNRLLQLDTTLPKNRSVIREIPLPQCSGFSSTAPSCGIHSISINFSRTMLVTGAANPNDAAVFQLPSFVPCQLLKKHEDWIFSTAWLTDTVLATGSRDSTVMLWSVTNSSSCLLNEFPFEELREHTSKVRDLKYCPVSETLVTLSDDGTCKAWDLRASEVVYSAVLCDADFGYKLKGLQCLAVDYPISAVGSKDHISFIDMRCGHVTKNIESLDEGWGVRSLSLRGPLLTCGGGSGRLSFYDMRAMDYIRLGDCNGRSYESGKQGFHSANSLYAHSYDPGGTSLLTAGGPANYGETGCYAAVWH